MGKARGEGPAKMFYAPDFPPHAFSPHAPCPVLHARGDRRVMHLHFVQSLEPLQGAGLGQAALSLHLAMRGKSVQCSVFGFQQETSPPCSTLQAPCPMLT